MVKIDIRDEMKGSRYEQYNMVKSKDSTSVNQLSRDQKYRHRQNEVISQEQ